MPHTGAQRQFFCMVETVRSIVKWGTAQIIGSAQIIEIILTVLYEAPSMHIFTSFVWTLPLQLLLFEISECIVGFHVYSKSTSIYII